MYYIVSLSFDITQLPTLKQLINQHHKDTTYMYQEYTKLDFVKK